MSVVVELPDEIASLLEINECEMNRSVLEAVVWQQYQKGQVSAGRSAELLGLTRNMFEESRRKFGVSLPFFQDDLDRDLEWAKQRSGNG